MHDTAMMFCPPKWDKHDGEGEILTEYFPISGIGQCNVVFTSS